MKLERSIPILRMFDVAKAPGTYERIEMTRIVYDPFGNRLIFSQRIAE